MSVRKSRYAEEELLLPEEHRETIRRLIRIHGEADAMEMLGPSRNTVTRALAALPMRRGSVLELTTRLQSEDIAKALSV